jgi:RNA polymerase sigma-70 factor (ECF subfamily)
MGKNPSATRPPVTRTPVNRPPVTKSPDAKLKSKAATSRRTPKPASTFPNCYNIPRPPLVRAVPPGLMGRFMNTSSGQTDLIQRARAGDRAALQQLLWDHYNRLVGFISPRLSGNLQRLVAIEDVVQETFIQAIRDIGNCQATSDQSFAAWLSAIADHRLHDIIKGLYRQKRGGDRRQVEALVGGSTGGLVELVELVSDHRSTPGRRLTRLEAIQALQIGIAALPDDQREAIRLRYLAGKSIEDTAAEMGRTTAAVNGLVRRGKESLRNTLLDSSGWPSGR